MTKATSPTDPDIETEWAAKILSDACATLGLDCSGAKLIKFTNNAVWSLASASVVVRIPGSAAVRDRVPKVVAVARWLADYNMPSARLIEEFPQPLRLDQHEVTFWHKVSPSATAAPPNGHDLGRILRRYHALPDPAFELPPWQPLSGIRQRIAEQDVLEPRDQHFLENKCDETEELLARIDFQLPSGPIHGDGFAGNLIPGPLGPVICDFDSAAYGPREWDLAPVALGNIRFQYATNYHQQLVEEYGFDITRWRHFPVLRQLRELQLVTSVLPVLRTNPTLTEEWQNRFRSFRDGDTQTKWSPYR
ncbi:phosphotransferase [Nocardia nepalensis]|uniref:phosphotransferase n=1 Tax=Nocardia nepalensis TaxID=3375448 RepID=UPI003B674B05